jgi:L,D-peptidoglycan transpeptidase YkuD (ErfK/YbiS/YcfS/YnhG family)
VRGIVLAAAVAGACGHGGQAPAPDPGPRASVRDLATKAVRGELASTQLVTAVTDGWDATHATLRLWSRATDGWHPVGEAWPAVIGKSGAAWGIGLHGRGAPPGRDGPVKREGDGRSPAGRFALTRSFGYAAAPPAATAVPYTQTDASWFCVDDPGSRHYGEILRRAAGADWTSAEPMRRDDAAYTWVIEVAHNAGHEAGGGSCIFLHVWAGPDSTTVGCTAMAEPALARLLAALRPEAHPQLVLLPRAEYDALAVSWGLPAQ